MNDLARFVTATDLTGEPIELRPSDGVAQAYDYEHVSEFRLSWPETDEFSADVDGLLVLGYFADRRAVSAPPTSLCG